MTTQYGAGSDGPRLRVAVGATADYLQSSYLGLRDDRGSSEAKAALAQLRRNASLSASDNPVGVQETLLLLNPGLSEGELGKGNQVSPSEWAAYQAMALFARHMQSARNPVHTTEQSFAWACGRLVALSESNSVKPRFDAMQLAATPEARATHLRSLVDLLKSKGLAFDYGALAQDLRSLINPTQKNGVLLRWGRDFSRGVSFKQHADTTAKEI
ncbi:CRISPR system Cascade subunit CasB [Corynebacterium mycetoides]|uniref:CRISPR system Cascade subunit CasB n=1 Tax=Corynebacterium mycetoides TaxID=38302 RepID=A0A1G9PCI4_9CORY|nr:type I-E CRISPR-associated protein Cse2/CasB [Corynebacterium mycetoides]SDL96572.1 CRISPR system Cascade subunit CasB [Corynebacterium mycetoides]